MLALIMNGAILLLISFALSGCCPKNDQAEDSKTQETIPILKLDDAQIRSAGKLTRQLDRISDASIEDLIDDYSKLAQAGDPMACYAMYVALSRRANLLFDDEAAEAIAKSQAYEFVETSAAGNYGPALFVMYDRYKYGLGVPEDSQKAEEYLKRSVETNFPRALMSKADESKSLEELVKATELGWCTMGLLDLAEKCSGQSGNFKVDFDRGYYYASLSFIRAQREMTREYCKYLLRNMEKEMTSKQILTARSRVKEAIKNTPIIPDEHKKYQLGRLFTEAYPDLWESGVEIWYSAVKEGCRDSVSRLFWLYYYGIDGYLPADKIEAVAWGKFLGGDWIKPYVNQISLSADEQIEARNRFEKLKQIMPSFEERR